MADGAVIAQEPLLRGACCPAPTPELTPRAPSMAAERWAREAGDGVMRVDFLAPDVSCAACISSIEKGLQTAPGVESARVNLSMKRVGVTYRSGETSVDEIARRLEGMGYGVKPFDAAAFQSLETDAVGRDLLACLAVAGFAAANVMLLSVSVWSGAVDATRDLMHWLSALIALPAVAFAGRPFYRSAWNALRVGRLNMDVPITLAVLLAAGVSLFETAHSGHHAYFDASVSLLFFLLIGRYLDHRTRGMARSAAAELSALAASAATLVAPDGTKRLVAIEELSPGDLIEVAPGERIPADGEVLDGVSDVDRSMVTGETTPETARPGTMAHAGMMNLTGLLRLRVSATEDGTLLAEIARMIEAAERGANRYTRLADRAARIYAPGVHLIALTAFIGWMVWTGGDWRVSVMIASALLIITCPCALGLAVPAVQATAGGVLFRNGVLVKDGAALEKLGEIDTVVFDKTGTLTLGRPRLVDGPSDPMTWSLAAGLAEASRHPLSRALLAAATDRGVQPERVENASEHPGAGVEATRVGADAGSRVRLGRGDWCGAPELSGDALSRVWLHVEGRDPVAFAFEDEMRADAASVMASLKELGLKTLLLSGDRESVVSEAAARLGVDAWRAELTPANKLAALKALADEGGKVLMVGDGINDAPALAAAHVSMSPAAAADVSRAAAGMVFTGDALAPVAFAHKVSRTARTRALQNFAIAAGYNAMAIPLAMFGFVTPLIAALAMSGSSIFVTLNAVRLRSLNAEGHSK
ncbi:MAG: heavy metal translocating P-type ATPase [Pseudomonadota bacterium]